jgi:urease accessory protein
MTAVLDRRAPEEVGRRARLELVFAVRGGRTVLAHAYAEPPFRTGRWFAERDGLHMILTSSSPGIFGGDVLDQTIVVEAGARVRLTSQSAPQLHASADAAEARLRSTFRVLEGARLWCSWDPLIPFAGARLDQATTIDLAAGAELHWSDAIMNGRHSRGEQWRFSQLAHELQIAREGQLEYIERFHMTPGNGGTARPWIAADAAYFGTTVSSGPQAAAIDVERVHRALAEVAEARAAADRLDESLVLVRLMTTSGIPFHRARALVDRMFGDVQKR